ncbi:MAG: tetratricopeptide repeat protein [Flavobacteriales bacterium]|nr:tetratricopeptide repeat protein [Flavobacteriales bacterium]
MYKTLIIVILSIVFSSCGNDTQNVVNDDDLTQDTTVSEQTLEFRTVNDLLKNDINNSGLYLQRAKLFVKYNDLSAAVDDLDRAISVDSLIPEFYLLKAELLKNQDRLKESKLVLDKCMFIDNNNLKARIELGWLALISRNYKQALDYADAVLKRDVYNAEAYYLKGMIFEDKQDTTLAISSYITAVEQENDFYEAYMQLGLLHLNQPNSLAKDYLKNALRIDSNSLEALYAYAIACQEKGDYNEAIETYYKILSIDEYREPYFNLGFIHQEYLKVYDVAIEHYTKAIEVEPKYVDAYYNRALCYELQDELKKAEKDLRYALELSPQYTNAAIALERVITQ